MLPGPACQQTAMSREAGSCHVGPGARTRKPKKPHYIPRPWGKPYNYKCFQCPFTCLEKSHLYNHMKYSLCKDSLSLLLHAPRPRAPTPAAQLDAAPSTPDLGPVGTRAPAPREAQTEPGVGRLQVEPWKRGLGRAPQSMAPMDVARVGPEGGAPCYPPPLPGGPPEAQSFHLPLLGLSYPLGPALFSCLGPSLTAAHVPFLASTGPLLPVACPAPQGPARAGPVPRLYCPLFLGLPASGAASAQPLTPPRGPPATPAAGLGASWPWGTPPGSRQLEQVALRVAKRTPPPGSRLEPPGPLTSTARSRSWSSPLNSPGQRLWPEEQEPLSQLPPRDPEHHSGEDLELCLRGPPQKPLDRGRGELLAIRPAPDMPLDLSVRRGSTKAPESPPGPWRRPLLGAALAQGPLEGPIVLGPAGPPCGRTTKCEADSSVPPHSTPQALEDLPLPHGGWAPHVCSGGSWTPGTAPGPHSPRGSEL